MTWTARATRRPLLAALAVLLVAPPAALAHGGDPSVIHACVNPSGLVRVVAPDAACGGNEMALHWGTGAGVPGPVDVTVDCAAGQTVTQALALPASTLIIRVRGTCPEHVAIARSDVVLIADAAGGGLAGPDASRSTLTVTGGRVTIGDGLRVSGGDFGVVVRGAGPVTIRNAVVEAVGRTGIVFSRGASGSIEGTAVRSNGVGGLFVDGASVLVVRSDVSGNAAAGISVVNGGSARIGDHATAGSGNTVSGNATDGISISAASAQVSRNTIAANGIAGVRLSGATAQLGGNTITGNGTQGIVLSASQLALGPPLPGVPNVVGGNGVAAAPGTGSPGGIFAFAGSTLTPANLQVTGNAGDGINLQNSSATFGAAPTSSVRDNSGDGIVLGFDAAVLLFGAPSVAVSGNGGWGLRCPFNPGNKYSFGASGDGVSGNGAGDIDPGCVRF